MNNAKYFVEKFRIWSGCLIFFFVVTHLLNHMLGLFSWEVMEGGRHLFLGLWRNPVLNWVVVAALVVHAVLAMGTTLGRKSLRGLRGSQWAQILIGIALPVMLIGHITATKITHELYGIDDTYAYYMLKGRFELIGLSILFSILAWWHGSIGIAGVLANRPWYGRWRGRLKLVAWLFPALAMAGVLSGAHQVFEREALDPGFRAEVFQSVLALDRPVSQWIAEQEALIDRMTGGYLLLAGLLFAGRAGVLAWRKRRHPVQIRYSDETEISVPYGTTILEASLMAGVPHAHVCGGRGRCSTCRVRVYEGRSALPDPSVTEKRVLRQIGAAENVRLACQTRLEADCRVLPILPADTRIASFADKRFLQGADRRIAILFADLRGFTAFSENRLPFDVVFVLNQYFQAVGRAIECRGGYLDKFIGDGAMALFGVECDIRTACRQALEATWEIGRELDQLNDRLADELDQPLRLGIGLHCGDAIVGKMGYKSTSHLTAIGDAVNTAARLESMTKEYGAQLLVSEEVAGNAQIELAEFDGVEVAIRGKSQRMFAFVVPNVAELPVDRTPSAPPSDRRSA